MIRIKSTKGSDAPTAPADRYKLKDLDRRSRMPALFALFLTGFAAYLKSLLPAEAVREPVAPSEENQSELPPDEMLQMAEEADREVTPIEDPQPWRNVAALVPTNQPVSLDWMEGLAMWNVDQVEPLIQWNRPAAMTVTVPPANDNASLRGSGQSSAGLGGKVSANPPADQASPANSTAPGNETPPHEGGDGPHPENSCGCGGSDDNDAPGDADPDEDNRAPRSSGPVYLMDVTGCAFLLIGLSDLLRNTVDPDGDDLNVRNISVSGGTLIENGDQWTFRAGPMLEGPVTITYEISDGEYSVLQFAHFSVTPSVIAGTEGDDVLVGSDCPDQIDGGDGHDTILAHAGDDLVNGGGGNDLIWGGVGRDIIHGGAGNDIIHGGAGNDILSGGEGNDVLFGEDGNDLLFGGAGNDLLWGGRGNDVLHGEEGNDILIGEAGQDVLYGGVGDDRLFGGEGADVLHGEVGDDHLEGGDGNDALYGGSGSDRLDGGSGEDIVDGGAGDDILIGAIDQADDCYIGGEGFDILDYSTAEEALRIDLVSGTASGQEIGTDTLSCIEQVIAGSGNDHFIAGSVDAILTGGNGNDVFEFVRTSTAPEALFEITDFRFGDRIRVNKYDLFDEVFDEMEDQFESVFGREVDDDDFALRVRYEELGEASARTVIEADFNRDEFFETTIYLQGRHVLVVVEHA